MSPPTGAPRPHAAHDISPWEWLVAALGALVLGAALWMLVARGANGPARPPDVVVRVIEIAPATGGWLARFEAENRGDETAADLKLQGTLTRASLAVETAETQIDYLPGRSTRRGGLFFANDPRAATLELRAVSYQEP